MIFLSHSNIEAGNAFILARASNGSLTHHAFSDPSPPFGLTALRSKRYLVHLKGWQPLANAVFSAAVSAAREKETMVTQPYLEEAIQSVLRVKQANAGGVTVSVRRVSEEEAQEKIGGSKQS